MPKTGVQRVAYSCAVLFLVLGLVLPAAIQQTFNFKALAYFLAVISLIIGIISSPHPQKH